MTELAVVDRFGLSHTGHEREQNEDVFLLRGPLFMVADGVGGEQAGEVASRICADAFAAVDLSRHGGEDALREAIDRANAAIYERAREDPALAGMGTTVAAAAVGDGGDVVFAYVGDSRAYLLREGELRRLSEDHSLVGELVRSGKLSEAEAIRHPQRNVITRVLGRDPDVDVDTLHLAGQPADVVLLCSDGLNDMVSEEAIGAILAGPGSCEERARELIGAALAGGGEDNVTAVVFELGEPKPAEAGAATEALPALGGDEEPAWPRDRGERHLLRWTAAVVIALGVAAAIAVGAVVGLRSSHFIGADEGTGRVDVYQGVPVELPFGVKLYHRVYESPLRFSALDAATRARLFDHTLRSESDARRILERVEAQAP